MSRRSRHQTVKLGPFVEEINGANCALLWKSGLLLYLHNYGLGLQIPLWTSLKTSILAPAIGEQTLVEAYSLRALVMQSLFVLVVISMAPIQLLTCCQCV